jgi:hypothetical protein
MDEIEKRLRDATDNTVKFYQEWRTKQKDSKAREELMEAVHELRKVAARLEIEIAVSERDEMAAKPIPIPPHRAARKRPGEGNDVSDEGDDRQPSFNRAESGGNRPHHGGGGGGGQGGPRRRLGGGGDRPQPGNKAED